MFMCFTSGGEIRSTRCSQYIQMQSGYPSLTHWFPVHWVMIGSGNGLMAIHLEPITKTNDDLLSIAPL